MIKVGDVVNGHIINFVGEMFVEYGNGKRIYTRNIKSIISRENRKKSSIYHEKYRNTHKEKIVEYRKKYYKLKKKKNKEMLEE